MVGKQDKDREIIVNYTGEVSAIDLRLQILRLLLENRERGIEADDGMRKQQHRNICERE